jgi:hypothetical protein
MGIRFIAVLLGAALLMSLALITTSCNKPAKDTGAGTTTGSAPPVTQTASANLPKLQEYGADW